MERLLPGLSAKAREAVRWIVVDTLARVHDVLAADPTAETGAKPVGIVVDRYMYGMSFEEIANKYGIRTLTAKDYNTAGIKRLYSGLIGIGEKGDERTVWEWDDLRRAVLIHAPNSATATAITYYEPQRKIIEETVARHDAIKATYAESALAEDPQVVGLLAQHDVRYAEVAAMTSVQRRHTIPGIGDGLASRIETALEQDRGRRLSQGITS